MLIQLNGQYRIKGILMNYVLEERKVREKGNNIGEEYYNEIGYYPTLEEMINGMFNRHVQASNIDEVKLLIESIKTATQTVTQQIRVLEEQI